MLKRQKSSTVRSHTKPYRRKSCAYCCESIKRNFKKMLLFGHYPMSFNPGIVRSYWSSSLLILQDKENNKENKRQNNRKEKYNKGRRQKKKNRNSRKNQRKKNEEDWEKKKSEKNSKEDEERNENEDKKKSHD
ncbi:hypothetical protein L1887_02460 [Cichorium endivia]|nr:hypothetical protein L1887_02460 [Cichorium endivia]